MADFKTLLANAKKPKAEAKRSVVFGTGITQKVAKKAETTFEKTKDTQTAEKSAKFFNLATDKKPARISTETVDVQIIPTVAQSDIVLDQYQSAALEGLRSQMFGCLIGAAGTGKTTVLKQLVRELESTVPTIDLNHTKIAIKEDAKPEYNVAICFCSFTGRAVQQMKRALPEEYHPMCQTIHATLGYMPDRQNVLDDETGKWKEKLIFRPTFTAANQLPYRICVVDEAGMCPINLWNELRAALPDDCRIILVGDINQLPPVQGRSVLGFAMIKWPTFTLEKIHRQAEGNPIIANAHKILQGHYPQQDKGKFAIRTMPDGGVKTLHEATNIVKHLHQKGLFDPLTDAIIVPQNEGTLGQLHLNEKLVLYFNPEKKDETGAILNKRQIITAGYVHVVFAVGDKVMLLQNDRERGLTNGMTGVVTDLIMNGTFDGDRSEHAMPNEPFEGTLDMSKMDEHLGATEDNEDSKDANQRQASHIMTVEFTVGDHVTEVKFSTAGQYKQIRHAYAFTCHKSQGGEYPTVVILIHSVNIRMLNREWLYTAVTRAQERVIILCNDRGLAQSINIQRIKGKTVKEKAEQFIALQDKSDTKVPTLNEPERI